LSILLNLFRNSLCFLLVTNRSHFPFYLVLVHYKIPCTYSRKSEHYHPSELLRLRIRKLIQTSYFAHMTLYTVTLHHLLSLHCLLHHALSPIIIPCCSSSLLVVSSRILLGILFIYIYILSFSHLSHRLLKKGLTSPCSFIHFAGSSHCKCINSLRCGLLGTTA
jgi:hypothetical protein